MFWPRRFKIYTIRTKSPILNHKSYDTFQTDLELQIANLQVKLLVDGVFPKQFFYQIQMTTNIRHAEQIYVRVLGRESCLHERV